MKSAVQSFTTGLRGFAERSRLLANDDSDARTSAARPDLLLAMVVLALTALGIVIVHSAGAVTSQRHGGDALSADTFSFYFLERQALHALVGLGAMFVAFFIDPRAILRHSGWIFVGTAGLLVAMLLVPGLGHEAGGAKRWLAVGPIRFQPSELAKVALLFFFARSVLRFEERLASFRRGFVPLLLLAAAIVLPVLLQPDFGMAVTLGALAFAMLFAAGARITHLGLTVLAAVPVGWWLIEGTPYRARRWLAFLDPMAHRREEGYQIYESMVSFASGEWTGVGLGAGHQKLGRFPEYHNDFVLAAVGEELGFLGVAAVIALFAVLVWRGLRIARRVADRSLSLLAFGITALLGVQALCHMGVVMAVLPTKGLPLPFVSYGGTSLVVSLFLTGVLLYISAEPESDVERQVYPRHARTPARPAGRGPSRRGGTNPAMPAVGVGVADFADRSSTRTGRTS